MVQSKHNIHQKKAEFLSYWMVLITLFIKTKMKIKVQDHTYILIFCLIFLDTDNSVNIIQRLLKSFLLVPAIVIEGTVSQIFYLVPSSRFMCFQNLCSNFFLMFPNFWHKIKTKT